MNANPLQAKLSRKRYSNKYVKKVDFYTVTYVIIITLD